MESRKNVIGITGRMRAGKETAAAAIASVYQVDEFASSDALYETLRLFCVPIVRKNTQALSTFLRASFTPSALEYPLTKRVEASDKEICIVSSLRRKSDFSDLKKRFSFILLFIDTPTERRYTWFVQDVKDQGDEGMTLDEFLVRDSAEAEVDIDDLKSIADCVIENIGSKEEFSKRVIESISEKIYRPDADKR